MTGHWLLVMCVVGAAGALLLFLFSLCVVADDGRDDLSIDDGHAFGGDGIE